MRLIFKIVFLFLLVIGCTKKAERFDKKVDNFTSELLELKLYYRIPGLAVSIDKDGRNIYKSYFGVSDIEKSINLDSSTLFPIASITKVFSGVLLMKLVEQKKLSLDEPINKFFSKPVLGDSIQIKHILSHTSQGNIGKEFYYSSRFGLLTNVIEKASGKSFSQMIEDEILNPLNLKNTFLLKDSTQVSNIAKPYILDNGIESGFIDYGYSSSAGIVSNLEDLATFNEALDKNSLISEQSKKVMFSSFKDELPYGYGIFNQQYQGVNIVWAYGQYDCYSSLLLKIPSKNITLILLANNSLLSDPARLINGDITSSLFAMSFLKNYIFEFDDMELFDKSDIKSENSITNSEFYRKKLLAQALAESYMARFKVSKLQKSAKLIEEVFMKYPNYLEYADLNLLHNLTFLKDIAFYRELGEFNNFDTQIENIGKKLLNKHSENPYANSYMGTYYARKEDKERAKYHFKKIVNAKNYSVNWYTNDAKNWINKNSQ